MHSLFIKLSWSNTHGGKATGTNILIAERLMNFGKHYEQVAYNRLFSGCTATVIGQIRLRTFLNTFIYSNCWITGQSSTFNAHFTHIIESFIIIIIIFIIISFMQGIYTYIPETN